MSSPTTYSLSSLYAALGVRAKNAFPSLKTDELTPVIVLGNIETFAPAVIEARGTIQAISDQCASNQYASYSLFAVSPGGLVVEGVDHGPNLEQQLYTINVAPQKPFTGAVMTNARVLSMGGRPLVSIVEFLKQKIPRPQGQLLGGSQSQAQAPVLDQGIWVPPGWYFWIVFENTTFGVQTFNMSFRWRELLEPQGAP